MQKDIFYNIATQSINDGLKDFEISSSQDYFIMLEAPTNANIRVKLNSVTAHEIPIKENWQFASKEVNKMYISCDAIAGAFIKYGQADGNLNIQPNPTINKIDTITNIGNFENNLLEQLDKIINPYLEETLINISYYNLVGNTTILNIVNCDFDEIEANISVNDSSLSISQFLFGVDGINIIGQSVAYNDPTQKGNNPNFYHKLKDLRGKDITVIISGTVLGQITKKTKKV